MRAVILLFLLPIAAVLALGGLTSAGVCLKTGKRLSDGEVVEIATRDAFHSYVSIVRGPHAAELLGPGFIAYPDLSSFKAANPECCQIVEPGDAGSRDEMAVGGWPRLKGLHRAWVWTEVDAGNGNTHRRLSNISNCGRPSSGPYE